MRDIRKNYDEKNEESSTKNNLTTQSPDINVKSLEKSKIEQLRNNNNETKYDNQNILEFQPESKSESESEEYNTRNKKKKKINKKILKKRLRNTFNNFDKFKSCTSKKNLQKILFNFTNKAKLILKFYISECFIIDIFNRKIENKRLLMAKRQLFYNIVNNPNILSKDCHFDNNLLKNFCTGASNFIKKHFFDIEYQMSRKFRDSQEIGRAHV